MHLHLFPVLLVAGLILVLGVVYIAYPIYHAIAISKGIQARVVPYEQHPEHVTMRILVAGDSTAVGTGAADPRDSTAGRLGAHYPNADITNIGVNGLKLAGLQEKLATLPTDAPAGKYDLIVLQIGANDVVGYTAFSDVRTRLDAVLTRAQELGTSVVVFSSGDVGQAPVFKFPASAFMTYRTKMVRRIFLQETASRPGVQYVDLYKERDVEPFNTDIARYYAADYFHPTGDGYGLWFNDILPHLPPVR